MFDLNKISQWRSTIFGMSIILIVFFHFSGNLADSFKAGLYSAKDSPVFYYMTENYLKYIGSIGVEIFTFLSGVGLYFSFSKNENVKSFYLSRAKRLLIPYVLVGSVFWVYHDIAIQDTNLIVALKDFFFITFFTEGVAAFWFILLMIICYLIFPGLYKIMESLANRHVAAVLLVLLFAAVPFVIYYCDTDLFHKTGVLITRIPLFVLGVYAGKYIKESVKVSALFPIVIIISGIAAQYYAKTVCDIDPVTIRYAAALFSFSVMIIMILLFEALKSMPGIIRFLEFSGSVSLELYLIHLTLRYYYKTSLSEMFSVTAVIVLIVVSFILAALVHKSINAIWILKKLIQS